MFGYFYYKIKLKVKFNTKIHTDEHPSLINTNTHTSTTEGKKKR